MQLVLETASEGVLDEWQQRISAAAAREPRRPRRLLVFVNPFGGSRRAAQIWRNVVKPVFDKAGIKSSAVETQHGGHARSLLTSEEGGWGAESAPRACARQRCTAPAPLLQEGSALWARGTRWRRLNEHVSWPLAAGLLVDHSRSQPAMRGLPRYDLFSIGCAATLHLCRHAWR